MASHAGHYENAKLGYRQCGVLLPDEPRHGLQLVTRPFVPGGGEISKEFEMLNNASVNG